MRITFDPVKREETRRKREIDFLDAKTAFDGPTYTVQDERFPYAEDRFITVGFAVGPHGHRGVDAG